MEKFLKNLQSSQLYLYWDQLANTKKAGILAVTAAFLIASITLIALSVKKELAYLYVDLSPDDVRAITESFARENYEGYIVDKKGIQVPVEDLARLRLTLSQEGLPNQGHVGWEKFDESSFTRTEFEREVQKVRAIQGELARTITSIEGIQSARVHIVTPKQRLFSREQSPPTAAVYLRTKHGQTVSERQIMGIVHLVSKSVEGLESSNISVIDASGKLLTPDEEDSAQSRKTQEVIENKLAVERALEQKIKNIVGRFVGAERVEAKVNAEIDFTEEEQTISDIDPDRVVVISQNTMNQEMSGGGMNPTGIPGAKSNVPGEGQETNVGQGVSTENSRNNELINYEVAKTVSHKVLPTVKLNRVSAAVIVDGKQALAAPGADVPFEARNEEEMKQIEELVKTAIGFKDGRDEVKVHNVHFKLDFVQVENLNIQKTEDRKFYTHIAFAGLTALALVLFFAFVVRPYFRWLTYDPERKEKQTLVEEYRPDLSESAVQSIKMQEDVPFEKMNVKEKVAFIAKNDPKRATEAVRIMLNPHSA